MSATLADIREGVAILSDGAEVRMPPACSFERLSAAPGVGWKVTWAGQDGTVRGGFLHDGALGEFVTMLRDWIATHIAKGQLPEDVRNRLLTDQAMPEDRKEFHRLILEAGGEI